MNALDETADGCQDLLMWLRTSEDPGHTLWPHEAKNCLSEGPQWSQHTSYPAKGPWIKKSRLRVFIVIVQ